jgi:hypothetical protein
MKSILILMLAFCCSGCTSLIADQSNENNAVVSGWCSAASQENAQTVSREHCQSFQKTEVLVEKKTTFGCTYTYRCADPKILQAEYEAQRAQQIAAVEKIRQAEVLRQQQEAARQKDAQHKIDTQDNNICVSYGLAKGTESFANCRMKLRQDRDRQAAEQAALQQYQQQQMQIQQQQLQAQQNADQAARWQNFWGGIQNYANQQQAIQNANRPPAPTNTFCVPVSGGMSCRTQ